VSRVLGILFPEAGRRHGAGASAAHGRDHHPRRTQLHPDCRPSL